MTTIKVNPLSKSSIEKAKTMLLAYKLNLRQFPNVFSKEVERVFNEILQGQAPFDAQGLWTSYVIASSNNDWDDKSGKVFMDEEVSASAVFVFEGKVEFIEFGTGVIGKNQHGGINEDWLSKLPPPYTAYNAGPRIYHFEDENQDYWVYNDETGKHVTHGRPADPFIYRSVQELRSQAAEIAKAVYHADLNATSFSAWS